MLFSLRWLCTLKFSTLFKVQLQCVLHPLIPICTFCTKSALREILGVCKIKFYRSSAFGLDAHVEGYNNNTLLFFHTAPTGAPQAFENLPSLVFSTNITVQWQRVLCSERNSEITQYLLQYSLEGRDGIEEVEVSETDESNGMYTAVLVRLQPLSEYTFTTAAVNSGGQRGPNTTITVTTSAPESKINYDI